ncbi:MAG: hypothetical protein N2253_05215 [Bacteroidia bacterium]|nr:hypothetical protein [Bacteroidia bacterium]MCX7764274.1 hypothetical protein [Bacteroidia bacterium]MDW8058122.1 hypothetical protein [Bacteroidia bacterium]
MKNFLWILVGLTIVSSAYGAATTPTNFLTEEVATVSTPAPIKRKSWWQRLKDRAHHAWQALKEKLRTATDDLVRLLIIALIIGLIVSILYWLLPWPLDVIIVLIALIVLIIFLLRYV